MCAPQRVRLGATFAAATVSPVLVPVTRKLIDRGVYD